MPTSSDPVAAAVRAEVARAGITGRQLARDLGWTPALTQRRLAGRTPFQIAELRTIAEHLGIPVVTFLEPSPAERAS